MRKIILTFSECEHYEDLSNYAEDVTACGGIIDGHEVSQAEETGTLECSVPNDFWTKFKTTNAFEFLEGY